MSPDPIVATFRHVDNTMETTGQWFNFWAQVQKEDMKEGFLQEGANLALRFKLASILNDAVEVI